MIFTPSPSPTKKKFRKKCHLLKRRKIQIHRQKTFLGYNFFCFFFGGFKAFLCPLGNGHVYTLFPVRALYPEPRTRPYGLKLKAFLDIVLDIQQTTQQTLHPSYRFSSVGGGRSAGGGGVRGGGGGGVGGLRGRVVG